MTRTITHIAFCIIILFIFSCSNKSEKDLKSKSHRSAETYAGKSEKEADTGFGTMSQEPQTVKDIDGNEYSIVKIGKQTWMAANLKTTRYNDGTAIPLVTEGAAWAALSAPAYCWYDNDESFKSSYGALYNGYAVSTGKLCPDNWHVPGDDEWAALARYLGGDNFAGEKLKAAGTDYWVSPNQGATNETGFTALPGGLRYQDGIFHDFGFSGYWWSSTEYSASRAWFSYMDYEHSNLFRFNNLKMIGFSVRCIRNY